MKEIFKNKWKYYEIVTDISEIRHVQITYTVNIDT